MQAGTGAYALLYADQLVLCVPAVAGGFVARALGFRLREAVAVGVVRIAGARACSRGLCELVALVVAVDLCAQWGSCTCFKRIGSCGRTSGTDCGDDRLLNSSTTCIELL